MRRRIIKRKDIDILAASLVITVLIFSGFYVKYASAEAVTLTASIQESTTFSSSTNVFGNLTPGTYKNATTTLSVETNSSTGYNITLSGDDQGSADTVMDLDTDASVGITDQTEWIPGAATTTAGNAVIRTSLDSSGDVLAFRVMSSSTAAFYADAWWGADDTDGTALWAGIASSTASDLKIGSRSTYGSGAQLSTGSYYLDVAASQKTGAYSGGLTYTCTANP